jgi:vitamin B12 transporter
MSMKIRWVLLLNLLVALTAAKGQDFASIHGQVVDSLLSEPIAGVLVSASPDGAMTTTDENGRYRLRRLSPGSISLTFESAFHARFTTAPMLCRPGDHVRLDVRLEPTVTVVPGQKVVGKRVTSPGLRIVTHDKIAASRARDAGGLLHELGYFVTGDGKSKQVSMHGFAANAVLVLVDGQPLNPDGGAADLAQIPLKTVERIEVYSAGAASLFGPNALGGAVNIISRKLAHTTVSHMHLSAAAGDFGQHHYSGSVETSMFQRTNLMLDYSYSEARNDYRYEHPYFGEVKREDNFTRSQSGFLSVGDERFPELNISVRYFSNHSGVPGAVLQETPTATAKHEGEVLTLTYARSGVQVLAGLKQLRQRFIQSGQFDSYDLQYNQISRNERAEWSGHVSDMINLGFGAEYLAENYFADDLGKQIAFLPATSRRTESLFGSLNASQSLSRVILNAEARYRFDRLDNKSFTSPYLGLTLDYDAGFTIGLEGNYGESYRYPPIDALFWREDVFTVGNPDLRPETANTREWGAHATWTGPISLECRTVWFASNLNDQITWRRRYDGKYQPININQTENRGNESAVNLSVLDERFSASYSRVSLSATNRTVGDSYYGLTIPFQPDRTERLNLTVKLERFMVRYGYSFTGKRFIREANTKWQPPFVLHDLHFEYALNLYSGKQTISLDWLNLADAKYELLERMPMPPESITVGLGVEF